MARLIAVRLLVLLTLVAGFAAVPSVCEAANGFTVTAPFAGRAVTSCSDVSMSGGIIDSAGVAAGSTAPTNAGNVFTNGNITLSGSSTIKGNAVIGPARHVTTSGSAAITGTTTNASSTFNCQPIDLVALKNIVSVTNDNSHIPQTTNHHNALVGTSFTMSGTDGITIPAGTYYFTNVSISGSSVITLSGPVNILVNGSVSVSGGSIISSNGYGLHFWVMGSSFALSSSTFKAFVYAPSAAASLSSSTLVGGLWANTVSISGNSHMTAAIDDIPPQVAITSPADNSGTSDPAHLVVRGTVSDGQSDVSVKVNGQTATIAADGTWQITLNISGSPSPVTITAVATDIGGTTATATIHVVTAVPLVTLTSPAPDSFIATRTPNLTGSAGTSASVTVNGTPAAIAGGSWSLSGLNLGNDGPHTLTITGTNAAGTTSIHPVLSVDTTPPTVTPVVTPARNAAGWNKGTATVSFNCVDSGSGVATCSPNVVVSAETASQTVNGTGVDKVGNAHTEPFVVKLDTTAPAVTISTPSAGATVTSATLAVSGTATDALSGIDVVKCNGATATRSGNNFDCSVTLVTGDNLVTVSATDIAGNINNITRHVTYNPDASAPVVTITSPANNSFTKQTTVIVTGTATDDVAVATVTVNGNPVTLNGNSWTATVTLSGPDGVKTITARATDTSGNPGTATAQITLDTAPPSIDVTSPADHVSVTDPSLTVTGTVNDALSGVAGVTCNNVAAAISGTTYRCSVLLVEGDNTITAVATDGAGNTTPATIHATFTADTSAPVITITAPAAGLITKETTLTVSGTALDDVSVASVTVNGVPVSSFSGGNWTTQVELTPGDGAKTITARATDGTGKSSSAVVQVTLDTTPPSIAITTPASGSTLTSESLTVSGSVDDLAGLSTVTCNGVNGLIENGTFTCSVTLVPGINTITATATDKAGNSAESTIHATYTRDLQAPTITITAPVAGTVTRDRTITVSGTAADDVAVASVKVEGVGVPFDSNGNWTTTVTLTGADGPKPITASVTDGTGKSNQAQVQIALDTTTPTVAITSPANHSSGTSSSLTVSGSVSDASAITGVTCNGVAATLAGGTFTCVVTLVPGDNPITAAATDAAGNVGTSTITATYTPDTLAPSIVITSPANGTFTRDTSVVVTGTASDDVAVARVTVNDVEVPFPGGNWTATVPLTAPDGAKTITAVAFDTTGKSGSTAIQVTLDTAGPVVNVTTNLSVPFVAPSLTVSGTITDAGSGVASLTCNGTPATITSGTFTCTVALLEGSNALSLVATDTIGNTSTTSVSAELDTRAPELAVTAPVAGMCTTGTSLNITGRAGDPHLGTVTLFLSPGATSVAATLAADGSFSGSLPLGGEGKYVLSVTAVDQNGHNAVVSIPVTVDRTAPLIQISAAGSPFTGGAFNHALSLDVRAADADPATVVTATLGSTPYVSGTPITADGAYTLNVTALDCAGNPQQKSVTFRIDTVPPHITALTPAAGTTVTTASTAVTGTVDADDLTSVVIDGTSVTGTISGRNFTLNPHLAEGANTFTIVATDDAGNSSRQSYTLSLKTTTPTVEILEGGLPIAPNALFNRNVTPVIRTNDAAVTPTATLDTAPFTSGTQVSSEGSHTIAAHAADAYGHQSDATVTFTIDKTAPALTITAPADGATVPASTVTVTGTAGDAVRVLVNGQPATLTGGSFTFPLTLDLGETPILVTASDAAGNSATASVTVSRADDRPGLVLTTPANGMITNRSTVPVAGQVLTPTLGAHVTVNSTDLTPDSTGAFRIDALPLHEGDNTITASITGRTGASVTVHVTSDTTPPTLKVMANGVEMQPASRFATSPSITLQSGDNNPDGLTTTLTIDGADVPGASPQLTDGGHALTAVARDKAGNQTRVDRTFSVGSTANAAAGCSLTNFDPPNNAAVFSNSITFSGRSGGAAMLLVNGTHVTPDNGSFATSLALNNEGANTITVACADASGTATSDPASTLTIYRYTNAPSVTITQPSNEAPLNSSAVTVTGTVSSDVVSGDVNGIAFTPAGGTFSVPNVSLATGLNIITARARNAADRIGVATVRVVVANGTPTISITSPLPATQTGAATVDVSGVYTNVAPSTITVAGLAATTKPFSDTTGTFLATVALAPNATKTITVTGQNGAGTQTTASVDVRNVSGPSISITAPLDNTAYRSNATAPDAITGTIDAPAGSTVSVNGVAGTVTGNQFSATIDFQNGSSGVTPVIARVTTTEGLSASDSIRLIKVPAALTVVRTFPDAGTTSVDLGAIIVALFSNPLDGGTAHANGAVTLADDGGHAVTGVVFVDNDALSFAPNVPLDAGRVYTFTVTQAVKDIAGQSLASPFLLTFTTAGTSPATKPVITDTGALQGCFTSVTIKGTASAAGARLRLSVDGVSTNVVAAADKSFVFTVGLSGQPGFHVARIREVGADGTLSPEADVQYEIVCGAAATGPTVKTATLDRTAKTLTIQFSRTMSAATLTASPSGSIQLGTLSGSVALNGTGDTATVTYTGDVSVALTLTVTADAKDTTGAALTRYVQSFPVDNQVGGNGYITGAVYNASNGRPLQGATVVISPNGGTTTTDDHGRYSTSSLGEGAFTIQATAAGFTSVWRQVVVPAGSGVVPIDIRLTARGAAKPGGADVTLTHGGDTAVTKTVELFVPAAALPGSSSVVLTSVGGQSLAGLLPLGWSPVAAAEVTVDGSLTAAIPAGKLTFDLSDADVAALATTSLSVVQYDSVRDEWRTIVAVAAIASKRVTADVQTAGNYALVYPDRNPGGFATFAVPPVAHTGAALQGVANPCTNTPDVCRLTRKTFTLDPPSVTPSQRATATLVTDGTDKSYPSGTAVQAYIDEQLNLADGTVSNTAPFATDLLMYRSPAGDTGNAVFHVAPSSTAASVTLRDGVDHIRVVDYPGRIDRGALIGGEGGRVPGDDMISIDIPTGATAEPIHASVIPMTAADLQKVGSIAGFHIAGGFTFSLTRTDAAATTTELLKSAKGTFTIDLTKFPTSNRQVVIAELIDQSSFGPLVRLAATTTASTAAVPGVQIVTTDTVNPLTLPVDGLVRDGRYLVLTADAPVAFAWGQVRLGSPAGATVPGALVTAATGAGYTAPLGVADLTRAGGVFAIPVASQPAGAFSLKPRSLATGDGDVAVAAAAPAAGEKVAFGALVLAAQPPHLLSITPNNQEVATDAFQAVATFDMAIDPASLAGRMTVTNTTTGAAVAGTLTASTANKTVTFVPASALASGSRYTIVVQAGLRSLGGASLAIGGSASFTTSATPPGNSQIDPTKIQITIPQDGVSTIRGAAGALPNGDVALAIRRNQYFLTQYQTQVTNTDGSFSFNIGKPTGPDRVTIADKIDLAIQDRVSGSTIAVIPLTPFVTADGFGFVAPPDQTVTFKSPAPLNVALTVPAGAFDTPTIVTLAASPKSDFAAVPSFDHDLGFYGAVDISFDGTANKPLEIDLPAPAGTTTTGKTFVLGRLGNSSLGPRIEVDDLITVTGNTFTTRAQGTSSGQRITRNLSVKPNNTLVGGDVRNYMIKVLRSGKYTVVDLQPGIVNPLGWAAIDGLQTNLDVFWNLYQSLYVSEFYLTASHGRVAIPVASDTPFTVQGVDAATGIQLFQHAYDGVPAATNGQVTAIPPPLSNQGGPYPTFGDPFSIQIVEIIGGVHTITSIPGITIDDSGWADVSDHGTAKVSFNSAASTDPNEPARHLTVFNTRTGYISAEDETLKNVEVQVGDKLVIFTQSARIDPRSDLSIVFNEPIDVLDTASTLQPAFDADMRKKFVLWKNAGTAGTPNWQRIDAETTFRTDSGNRRILLHTDLQESTEYRLQLVAGQIKDTYTGTGGALNLAQPPGGGALNDINLYFSLRKPQGTLATLLLKHNEAAGLAGQVRDLALDGNLLLVSAWEGGLYAFDASDPANLDAANPTYAWASAPPTGSGQSWSLFVDNHGRIWSTALTGEFGVVRTFRTEDFINGFTTAVKPDPDPVTPFAGGTLSWRTGITVGIDDGLDHTLLSDRPEATPRKMQIVTQDDSETLTVDNNFDSSLVSSKLAAGSGPTGQTAGDFKEYNFTVRTSTGTDFPYVKQRITVRNVTAALRWSVDQFSGPNGSQTATFPHVLVRPGDQITVERNARTYGVVSLFGYGIGVYDLNAIESNSLVAQGLPAPGYKSIATLVGLTDGGGGSEIATAALTYTPDAVVVADAPVAASGSTAAQPPALTAIAVMPAKGLAMYAATPKSGLEVNGSNDGTPVTGAYDPAATPVNVPTTSLVDDPMLKAVKTKFAALFGRFNSIARYDAFKTIPVVTNGNVTGYTTEPHRYVLVSGGGYGVLVVDVTDASSPKLVDVIWVPNGAWAVRTVGSHYATSIDGDGRTLLLDLSNIDESDQTLHPWVTTCWTSTPLFPSLAASLACNPAAPTLTSSTLGTDDSRIIWRGDADPNISSTTLAAVGDPDTGMFFSGTLLQKNVRVENGFDPHVTMRANLPGGLSEINTVVPLGVAPNKTVSDAIAAMTATCAPGGLDFQVPTQCKENVSPGVFRLEMNLPGSITKSLAGGNIGVAIESERVADGLAEQTPEPLPRSQLRQFRPADSGNEKRPVSVSLRRVVNESSTQPYLRLQKGFNRFVSPWIIAVADPRASTKYIWSATANKEDAGCFQCTTPAFLVNKQADTDFFELYTIGRYITVRPEIIGSGSSTTIFDAAGRYKYLGDRHRVFARFATIPADTVRPPDALVAANAPPLSTGTVLSKTYLHSGETEVSAVDLAPGGRAGWDVSVDRTYRSRTLGLTPFGFGWDSTVLQRLRPLPTGDVEYRDGDGELWLFRFDGTKYNAPKGYFVELVHTDQGWTLIDMKKRITYFDDLGRLTKIADQFYTPDGKGNSIRYTYDANGRLSTITDPVDRATTFKYYPGPDYEGRVDTITDWHGTQRKVHYVFDANGMLTEADLPDVSTAKGQPLSPKRKYTYDSAAGGLYNDQLELATNLKSVIDPTEAAGSGTPRLKFDYQTPRDFMNKETWGTGESATFQYLTGANAITTVIDVLGQRRQYKFHAPGAPAAPAPKLAWYSQNRTHIDTLTEENVPVSTAPYGQLPTSVPTPLATPETTVVQREYKYHYNDASDTAKDVVLTNGWETDFGYAPVGSTQMVMNSLSVKPSGPGSATSGKAATSTSTTTLDLLLNIRSTGAFLDSVQAGGLRVDAHESERNTLKPVDANSVSSGAEYDEKTGLATKVSSYRGATGTGAECPGDCGAKLNINYPPTQPVDRWKRARPESVASGTAGLLTKLTYPDENTRVATDPRGVETRTEFDSWGRPIRITTSSDPTQQLLTEIDYDPSGRVHEQRRKQGNDVVATTYAYDEIGRVISVTRDHIAADGNPTNKTVETNDFTNFASGTIKRIGSGNAVTTTTLDTLGRTTRVQTTTGLSTDIVSVMAYDIANNVVYSSDTLRSASNMAYDTNGHRTDVQRADGSKAHYVYDGWGRLLEAHLLDRNGNEIAHRKTTYNPDGQVLSVDAGGPVGSGRTTTRDWDGGGRTRGLGFTGSDEPRAMSRQVDDAGRLQSFKSGTGSASGVTNPLLQTNLTGYDSSTYLPTAVQKTESNATSSSGSSGPPTYQTNLSNFDTLGNPKSVSIGNLSWAQQFNQAGDAVSFAEPKRPTPQTFDRDARGAVTTHFLADGNKETFDYHLTGSRKNFTDAGKEPTDVKSDLLGRPTEIDYFDGTNEKISYEGARIFAVKDRQERWQSYVYDKGHLTEVWATQSGRSSDLSLQLDAIEFDDAGRVVALVNPDVRIDFLELTFDGRPQRTRQTRYKNHMGLQHPQTTDVLDVYEQTHGYNGAGERTSYSIPPAAAAGFAGGASLQYDSMGNVKFIQLDNGVTMTSDYRGPGRPNQRDLSLPAPSGSNPKILRRKYAYKDDTGQLLEMLALLVDPATSGSVVVAGTHVGYNDGLQIEDAQLLGVSGDTRHSRYSYDMRGRLAGFITATNSAKAFPPPPGGEPKAPGAAAENPDPADFRLSQVRVPVLDATTTSVLTQHGVNTAAIDPPGMTASPLPGHKIGSVTSGGVTRTLDYGGKAELIDDGIFLYAYDRKGRLEWVMEKPATAGSTVRRIQYTYDSRNRLVGRTAQAGQVATLPVTDVELLNWSVETRPQILAADGLPAETTFIWDPVVDRLMTVVRAGGSFVPNDPNANIVKQFVHGEGGYDDPIQVTTVDTSAPVVPGQPAPVKKLYPIYDEAAGGSLQVVLNDKGEIVARSITTDPFGGGRFDLSAGAIDHIEVTASKSAAGALQSVTVTMRATEQVASSSLASGTRLAVVDANGVVLRTSAVSPVLDPSDPYSIKWTLSDTDWSALSDPSPVTVGGTQHTPAALSMAITSNLRATVWAASTSFLAAPNWATIGKPVYTSSTTPLEVRESLATVGSLITSLQPGETRTNVSYDIPNLSLVGPDASNPDVASLFNSSFQAQPFTEPFTHKVYVRNRWYDPQLGIWLTPDPAGYKDSSNLYAFGGGDPINHRDPTGLCLGSDETCSDIASALWGMVSSKKELKKTIVRTGASLIGMQVGVTKSVLTAAAGPVIQAVQSAKETGTMIGGAIAAYQHGGAKEVKQFAEAESKRQQAQAKDQLLNSIPIVGTIRNASKIVDTYEREGAFAGGMAVGETTVRAAGDVALVYGAAEALNPGPLQVFKAPSTASGNFAMESAAADSAAVDTMSSSSLPSGSEVVHGETFTRIGSDEVTMRVTNNVQRLEGVHDVVAHGDMVDADGAMFKIDRNFTHANQIADAVSGNPNWHGEPIRLVTCYGGCGPAQELSNILRVNVQGATTEVGIPRAPNSPVQLLEEGEWIWFTPED